MTATLKSAAMVASAAAIGALAAFHWIDAPSTAAASAGGSSLPDLRPSPDAASGLPDRATPRLDFAIAAAPSVGSSRDRVADVAQRPVAPEQGTASSRPVSHLAAASMFASEPLSASRSASATEDPPVISVLVNAPLREWASQPGVSPARRFGAPASKAGAAPKLRASTAHAQENAENSAVTEPAVSPADSAIVADAPETWKNGSDAEAAVARHRSRAPAQNRRPRARGPFTPEEELERAQYGWQAFNARMFEDATSSSAVSR